MSEYSKLIEKISNSPSIEVRYFRDYWKDLFPWVLIGKTSKSDLSCLYCNLCQYESNLKVKKYSLEIHQKTKKHLYAEKVAKDEGLFIEARRGHSSFNDSQARARAADVNAINASDLSSSIQVQRGKTRTRAVNAKVANTCDLSSSIQVQRSKTRARAVDANTINASDLSSSILVRRGKKKLNDVVTIKKKLVPKFGKNLEIDRYKKVEKPTEVLIQNQLFPPNESIETNDSYIEKLNVPIKNNLVPKFVKNFKIDGYEEVEKPTEVPIQSQPFPPNIENLETNDRNLDRPCSRVAYSPLLNVNVITTEQLSSEKECHLSNRCIEAEEPEFHIQNQVLPADNENLGTKGCNLDKKFS